MVAKNIENMRSEILEQVKDLDGDPELMTKEAIKDAIIDMKYIVEPEKYIQKHYSDQTNQHKDQS